MILVCIFLRIAVFPYRLSSFAFVHSLADLGMFNRRRNSCCGLLIRVDDFYKIIIRVNQRLFKIRNERFHVLVTSVRTLLAAFEYNLFNTDRNFRYELSGRWHRRLNMLDRDGNRRFSVERDSSGQHLEDCNAKRIDVTAFIGITAARLLRRGIVNRSHDIRSDRIARRSLRDSEICDLDLAVFRNNDVLWLDISVDNPRMMRGLQSHRDLNRYADGLLHGKP